MYIFTIFTVRKKHRKDKEYMESINQKKYNEL